MGSIHFLRRVFTLSSVLCLWDRGLWGGCYLCFCMFVCWQGRIRCLSDGCDGILTVFVLCICLQVNFMSLEFFRMTSDWFIVNFLTLKHSSSLPTHVRCFDCIHARCFYWLWLSTLSTNLTTIFLWLSTLLSYFIDFILLIVFGVLSSSWYASIIIVLSTILVVMIIFLTIRVIFW